MAVVCALVSVSCVKVPLKQGVLKTVGYRYIVKDPVADVLSLADLGAVSWIQVEQLNDTKTVTLMVRGWAAKGEEVLPTIVGVYEETAGGYLRMFPSGKVILTDNEYSRVAREAYGERALAEWLPAFMTKGPDK
ncbi:MAG TPA: hypothetical protein PKA27_12490, partial [Fimbriimonadaceae bacterium]|nr:hypothetical protein [Fimbriimonadaceae bacterium]